METLNSNLSDEARSTINSLMGLRRLTDGEMARRIGISRTMFNQRRNGRTDFRLAEVEAIAVALGVEPYVLLMPFEVALRWVLDNPAPAAKKRSASRKP